MELLVGTTQEKRDVAKGSDKKEMSHGAPTVLANEILIRNEKLHAVCLVIGLNIGQTLAPDASRPITRTSSWSSARDFPSASFLPTARHLAFLRLPQGAASQRNISPSPSLPALDPLQFASWSTY